MIGAGICRILAQEGCNVAVVCRSNETAAHKVCVAVANAGVRGIVARGDVATEDGADSVFLAALDAFGKVDILVNGAAVFYEPDVMLADMNLTEFDKLFKNNVDSMFLMSRLMVRHLMERNASGSIITLADEPVVMPGSAAQVAYATAKAAQLGMTKLLASEVHKHGIRVNALLPGFVEGRVAHTMEMLAARSMVGACITPQDVGNACAYLCSEKSRFSVGAIMDLTGGRKF